MRQTLRNFPPRMVSRKWMRQLSFGATLPSAAAQPPSAITVCALPSSDLHTRPVDSPWLPHSIAARSPAPPAPITTTSCSKVWMSDRSAMCSTPRAEVVDVAHRHHTHVEVGEAHPDHAEPGEQHVAGVEPGHPFPDPVAGARRVIAGEAVELAADQVAERMTAEDVGGEQNRVEQEHDGADADAELPVAPERHVGVVGQDHDEPDRDVHRVAMQGLKDQQPGLA